MLQNLHCDAGVRAPMLRPLFMRSSISARARSFEDRGRSWTPHAGKRTQAYLHDVRWHLRSL